MHSVEARLNEALARIKQLESENVSLKTEVSNNRIDAAYFERELRINNAGLPCEAKERLHRAFEHSKDNAGLKQAINAEKRRYQR